MTASPSPTYFVPGDQAVYHGDVQGVGLDLVVAGDAVVVHTGNLDEDDDVWVTREGGAPIPVSAEQLEWVSGA